jgi:hypothetical protein
MQLLIKSSYIKLMQNYVGFNTRLDQENSQDTKWNKYKSKRKTKRIIEPLQASESNICKRGLNGEQLCQATTLSC